MKSIVKLILAIVNIALAVLLLGSTLAGWFLPSKMIVFSLLSYTYLYLLIANVVMLIVWLLAKSKWFLLPLAAIVVRFSFLPLFFQVGGTETLGDEELAKFEPLKVMTFNAHHFQGVERDAAVTDYNMGLFIKMVEEERPDLLAMQEYIGRGDSIHLTDRLTQMGYTYQATGYQNGSMTGNVIFSKLPIVGKGTVQGSSRLYTDLLWMDDTIRVYGLHLESYRLDEHDHETLDKLKHGEVDSGMSHNTLHKFAATIRRHEEELNMLKPHIDECPYHCIAMGDFNDTPASYFYQQLEKQLNDSYCEAGQGFSTTYHGNFTTSHNAIFPAFRIDMVFHDDAFKARTYKRIKSEISDHFPVVVTLEKHQTK